MIDFSKSFRFRFKYSNAVLQPRIRRNGYGLGCSGFARRYCRNHFCFLLLRVLRCFSSPRSPPRLRMTESLLSGCPIRKSRNQRLFAPNPGLSQLITSFIASESLGIRRLPFHTFFFRSFPKLFGKDNERFFFRYNFALLILYLILVFQHVKDLFGVKCCCRYNHVENNGFEPLTPCVQGRCSSQLS